MSCACVICLENFSPEDDHGLHCPSGHYICKSDLSSYVSENILPQIFKLRERQCSILCPEIDCNCSYNSLKLYERLPDRERMRYLATINDTMHSSPCIKTLRPAIFDILTLKCPSCNATVDPMPDACSAVMCLSCGGHYCNYCFAKFSGNQGDKDRADCHIHVASHSPLISNRDAFLPSDVVLIGQRKYQADQFKRFLSLALTSPEYGINSGHEIILALILCHNELSELMIDVIGIWNETEAQLLGKVPDVKIGDDLGIETSEQDTGNSLSSSSSLIARPGRGVRFQIDSEEKNRKRASSTMEETPAEPMPEDPRILGAKQLSNAMITGNVHAANQVIHTYKDGELDVDYISEAHGIPLASLAILSRRSSVAIELLKRGAKPHAMNREGRNLIYIAAESGDLRIFECLAEMYPDLDMSMSVSTEQQEYTPIHVAARYNHGALVRWLADRGVALDLVEKEHGYTPLTLAVVLGHEWAARELIEAGARPDVPSINGRTALFVAAEKGLGEMIRLMIEHGKVDVNAKVQYPSGLRLIHVASFHKQEHLIRMLIQRGADINIPDDESGYVPLALAIIAKNMCAASDLINAGADINIRSKSGRKPIYIAIEKGLLEVVDSLLRVGAEVNEPTTSEASQVLPIHVAILHRQSHLLPTLIAHGADINATDRTKQCCPIIMATILNDEWALYQLLVAGADVNQLSREGRSAMYVAAEKGYSGIVRLLVENGNVDVNGPTTNETHRGGPLHVAAMFDQPAVVKLLLGMGADSSRRDALHRTPLDLAVESRSMAAKSVLEVWDLRGEPLPSATIASTNMATADDT